MSAHLQILRRFDPSPRTSDVEHIFATRYEQLTGWALQLTQGDRVQAEDLVHDAYVQFSLRNKGLADVENLDGYLFISLRHLYLAKMRKASRSPMQELSIAEYDSAMLGLREAVTSDQLSTRNELQWLCAYLCWRKESVKGASLLLLRFFHGYFPDEIVAVSHLNHPALRQRLHTARTDAKSFLTNPAEMLRFSKQHSEQCKVIQLNRGAVPGEDLLAELRRWIFDSRSGICIPLARQDNAQIQYSTQELAHLVSCRACLEKANKLHNLRPGTARLLDEISFDNPEDRGPIEVPTKQGKSRKLRLAVSRQRLRETYEHRPLQLCIAVNGRLLAWRDVTTEDNRLQTLVHPHVQLEFIEIFSEQGIRMMLLSVPEAPPVGPFEISDVCMLSHDRLLRINVRFTGAGPSIEVLYSDPSLARASWPVEASLGRLQRSRANKQQACGLFGSIDGIATPLWKRYFQASFWLQPIPLASCVSSLLIGVLLFTQIGGTSLKAEEVLQRAEQWERGAVNSSDGVIHRTFDFSQTLSVDSRPQKLHGRVEVWDGSSHGKRQTLSRLYSEGGETIATTDRSQPLSESTAWQFVPSVKNYRALVSSSAVDVKKLDTTVQLRAKFATLTLDAASYRPARETIDLWGSHFSFREITTEVLPWTETPLALGDDISVVERAANTDSRAPSLVSSTDLDEAEIAVRMRLHQTNADMGEDVHIERARNLIHVTGIVNSTKREKDLQSRLIGIPHLQVHIVASDRPIPSRQSITRPTINISDADTASAQEATQPLLQDWLGRRFSDAGARSAFAAKILHLADQAMWHANALQRLAVRYGEFNNPAVHSMAVDHENALLELLTALSQEMEQFPGIATPSLSTSPIPDTTAGARELELRVRELNELMTQLLAEHDSPNSLASGNLSVDPETAKERTVELSQEKVLRARQLLQSLQ